MQKIETCGPASIVVEVERPMKQAQGTGGKAMPSGTLESPLYTSLVRTRARSSMLHQDTEKTSFENSYVRMNQLILSSACLCCHTGSVFFPIGDGDSPTHTLIVSRQPSDTDVSLVRNNSNYVYLSAIVCICRILGRISQERYPCSFCMIHNERMVREVI